MTIKVHVTDVAPIAKQAMKEIKLSADDKWTAIVDEFYEEHRLDRKWIIGDYKFADRIDAEYYLGRVDGDDKLLHGTDYYECFFPTEQYISYYNLVKLAKITDTEVKMSVREYLALMSFKTKD